MILGLAEVWGRINQAVIQSVEGDLMDLDEDTTPEELEIVKRKFFDYSDE